MDHRELEESHRAFAEMAQPHYWLATADDLYSQAVALRAAHYVSGLVTRRGPKGEVQQTWGVVDRSVFLLGGFALENAIKAFLVYENPLWIANGRLDKNLRSHDLVKLRAMSDLVPYKKRYTKLLRQFQEGTETWARYPCALSYKDLSSLPTMEKQLWDDYSQMMSAYGRKLMKLLGQMWTGPHNVGGYMTYQGAGMLGAKGTVIAASNFRATSSGRR